MKEDENKMRELRRVHKDRADRIAMSNESSLSFFFFFFSFLFEFALDRIEDTCRC